MTGRVIVVGSVNVDLVATVDRLPAAGETVTGATFARHPGGKGGNQAVAAARLGAAVEFVGAIGDDELGEEARAALAADGVGVTELATLAGPTGVALILVDRGGENLIAVASGANASLAADDVHAALARLGAGAEDIVLVGHEIPTTAAVAALEAGRTAGARTILNPAPAAGLGPDALAATDILVPNRIELGQLAEATGSAADGEDDAARATRLLATTASDAGVRTAVVVTLGADGALLVRPEGPAVAVKAPAIAALDTVGAGDTFVGALAAELATGRDLSDAVPRAVAAASMSTAVAGAREGMPTLARLDTFLAGGSIG